MPARTLPTSRAYWELRAEQVMDRVFTPIGAEDTEVSPANDDPESPIDVLVRDEGPSTAPTPGRNPHRPPIRSSRPRSGRRRWPTGLTLAAVTSARSRQVVALSSAVCVAMGGLSLLFWRNWTVARQDLRQERNLLLLERLRALGPGAEASRDTATTTAAAKGGPTDATRETQADANDLPPPPSEAWMEELASLPQSSAPPAEVLRVPVSSGISRPAPPASGAGGGGPISGGGSSSGGGSLPQLVGVVQVPGRPGSAIFQMGGSSSSAAVGESIGGSGWRLRSANGDTAVIERGGEQRQVSISSGF